MFKVVTEGSIDNFLAGEMPSSVLPTLGSFLQEDCIMLTQQYHYVPTFSVAVECCCSHYH